MLNKNTIEDRFNAFWPDGIHGRDLRSKVKDFVMREVDRVNEEEMTSSNYGDPIGVFMGKQISQMTRHELLEFARWAGKEIVRFQGIERATQDYRIDQEIKNL